MSRSTPAAWLLLLVVTLAACGDDPTATAGAGASAPVADAPPSTGPASSGTASPTPVEPAEPGTTIVARDSPFGTVLFDDTGQAVYLFDVETTSRPQCYGECAEAWPPVLTDGAPAAGRGARTALLGTTERRDGSSQVTYRGRPLYFYAHEGKGEVECHDVFLNGGTWYAVQPDGRRAP